MDALDDYISEATDMKAYCAMRLIREELALLKQRVNELEKRNVFPLPYVHPYNEGPAGHGGAGMWM